MQFFCPKHFTLMEDHEPDAVMPCPEPVLFDPALHVIVTCGPCARTTVIPVARVMQHKAVINGSCVLGECAATVVPQEVLMERPRDNGKSVTGRAKK